MLHEILVTLGGVFANELFNRIRYGSQLRSHANELAKLAPKGKARDIAEQAIILANLAEADRVTRMIDEQREQQLADEKAAYERGVANSKLVTIESDDDKKGD